MLKQPCSRRWSNGLAHAARQRGTVLLVALVVLVAMTLAGIGLMRSVFTSNRVAGNLAFQQATTQSAEVGIETAVAWLESNSAASRLHNNITIGGAETVGYYATRQNPSTVQSWEEWWAAIPVTDNRVNTLAIDAAGNTVSYVINRLCEETGDPNAGKGCSASPPTAAATEGGSKSANVKALQVPGQRYYRITVRVSGPRNTVGFVQAVVAL